MGTEVTKYGEQWAAQAETFSAKEHVESSTISHRGGVFKAGDIEFPELCVVILADVYENSYYEGAFDPNLLTPPKCFALGDEEEGMAPHEAMEAHDFFEAQNGDCASCPFNQWGSADKGKGKACKNTRRMSVIPAGVFSPRKGSRDLDLDCYITDDTKENEEHVLNADAMMIKVPPTSVREYKKFVQQCASEYSRPPAGIITRIYTEPMSNGGHKLVFEPIDELPDDLYPAVTKRQETASAMLLSPYSGPDEEVERQSTGRHRLKGLKRNRK